MPEYLRQIFYVLRTQAGVEIQSIRKFQCRDLPVFENVERDK
jgi:hypothetical protein